MAKLANWALDERKSTDGVWFQWAPKLYIQIARAGTAAYNKRLQELIRPHRGNARSRKGQTEDEFLQPFVEEAVADVCVRNWGADANGQRDADGRLITDAEQWEVDWEGDGPDPYDRNDDAAPAREAITDPQTGEVRPAEDARQASLACTTANVLLLWKDPRFEDLRPFCRMTAGTEAHYYVDATEASAGN